jgi:hypothetical protein
VPAQQQRLRQIQTAVVCKTADTTRTVHNDHTLTGCTGKPVAVTDVHSYYEEADVAAVLEALRQTCCASSADTSADGASPATPTVAAGTF